MLRTNVEGFYPELPPCHLPAQLHPTFQREDDEMFLPHLIHVRDFDSSPPTPVSRSVRQIPQRAVRRQTATSPPSVPHYASEDLLLFLMHTADDAFWLAPSCMSSTVRSLPSLPTWQPRSSTGVGSSSLFSDQCVFGVESER